MADADHPTSASRHRSALAHAAEEQGIVLTQMLIDAVYRDWSSRGAQFITEPLNNHGAELRCYLHDPDGYLIEAGETLAAEDARAQAGGKTNG
jgi:hypothetical protein